MAQRPPGGEYAAGGRMTQVDEVGQACRWRATTAEIFTICKKAAVPSCIRVPPDAGEATSGSRSAVARSTQLTSRSAPATPMEPARKPNSQTAIATLRPWILPSPVITASSKPVLRLAAARAAAYFPSAGACAASGPASHDW